MTYEPGTAMDNLELGALRGMSYLALKFVMQPESWPVFLAWANLDARVPLLVQNPEQVQPLLDRALCEMTNL